MLDPTRHETRGAKLGSRVGVAKKSESEYSTSVKAVQLRQRRSLMTEDELNVERAAARDRQAKRQAKRKIIASAEYKGLDEAGRQRLLDDKLQALEDVRNTKGISGT